MVSAGALMIVDALTVSSATQAGREPRHKDARNRRTENARMTFPDLRRGLSGEACDRLGAGSALGALRG